MKVDLSSDQVLIDLEGRKLKSYQKSQLEFWEFKNQDKQYICNDTNKLDKILNYFGNESIDFVLTESAKKFIDDSSNRELERSKLMNEAIDFKNGKYKKRNLADFTDFLEKTVKRKLKDHQIKAAYHLNLIGNGANFSVPGSGKTTVVLSYFQKLRTEKKANVLFVVGPPACFFPWQDEFKEVLGEGPKAKILAGLKKEDRAFTYADVSNPYELYLVTFQTLLNDSENIKEFLNNPNINALLVIDEAHYIKRVDGNWAKAVLDISHAASFRCVLTGTPVPKSYNDLLNIMEFLWTNQNPVNSEDRARLQIFEEKKDYESAAKMLDPKIGPLFYRVRKKDLHLKPQVFRKPIIVKMNEYEDMLYSAIANKIRDYSKDDYLKNIEVVSRLRRGRMIRLRQCLSYAKLLTTALEDYREDVLSEESNLKQILIRYDSIERPAKLDALVKRVKEINASGKKVVIWSNFIGAIDLIMSTLKDEELYSKKITGSVPIEREQVNIEETREKIRDEFVDPDSGLNILIANPAACAESISLHKTCHHAIYYDLSYNLAQYLQSLDRIHRVGASEKFSAHYDFLMYENSIDSDILDNLHSKAERMYKIIDKDYSIYSLDMLESSDDDEEAYERLFT